MSEPAGAGPAPWRLIVTVNGAPVAEHDRRERLAGHQRRVLDGMDADMDGGIELEGRHIPHPSAADRARFVAMQLLLALDRGDRDLVTLACAYLARRHPRLGEVRAVDDGEWISLELVQDPGGDAS